MNILSKLFRLFKKEKKADYFTFARFVKHQKTIGNPIEKKDVNKLENFATEIGVPFTARSHAQSLLLNLPGMILGLRKKAERVQKWWSDISKGSKITAIVTAVGVFLFMAKLWWAPFVQFLKDCFTLTVSLIESCLPVVYIAGPIVLVYYATKWYARYKSKKILDSADVWESMIPEIEENSKLLN